VDNVDPITEEVRALARLDLEGLREAWRRRYGAPPRLRSTDILSRLLAWRIQAEAFGGLEAETRAVIFRKSLPTGQPALSPGMRLDREWRGVKEAVDVVEGGFRWRETTYTSLSKVAQAITGVKWNGPRFFGLRNGPDA
jgi:hypothetical protein